MAAVSANVQLSPRNRANVFSRSMPRHVRHCVECPTCRTRYLIGFSPYDNGSYLVPRFDVDSAEYRLYCACGRSPVSGRCEELKRYAVSKMAHDRGYGSPEEIVPIGS
jgi:hypothetical protein